MTYEIKSYSKKKAKDLDLEIKPSTKKNKKIDVYYEGKYVCSVGDSRYKDYPTYLEERGKEYADQRRRLYKLRHNSDRKEIGTAGFFADWLLW